MHATTLVAEKKEDNKEEVTLDSSSIKNKKLDATQAAADAIINTTATNITIDNLLLALHKLWQERPNYVLYFEFCVCVTLSSPVSYDRISKQG